MKDSTIRIFWLALLTHVVAWTALCFLTQPNLPLDMVEMIYWGQQWQWGYHKHPPLPAWIAATIWELSGHQPLAMYFTAQLTIAATFWAVWQLAREGLNPRLALCAVGVLQACYYCTFLINDINNTIITRPFWSLAILFLYRATKPNASKALMWWTLTGAVIGLGMLSKYYMGVLVVSMAVIPLLIPHARKQLASAGPWVMAAVALAIFSPHVVWMFNNDFVTLQYIVNRSGASAGGNWSSHLLSPLSFILTQTGAWLPILLVAIPILSFAAIRKSITSIGIGPSQPYFRNYLLIVVGGPVLFYIFVAAITGAHIRSMWGGPLFGFWGLLLIELSKDSAGQMFGKPATMKVLRNCCVAAAVMLFGSFIRNGLGPLVRDDFSRIHFPGQTVSDEVNRRWNDRVDSPLKIVSGQMFTAGCVGIYSDRQVDVYANADERENPWVKEADMVRSGGIFVWEVEAYGPTPPRSWLNRFPNSEVLETFECPAEGLAADRLVKVGMLYVPPHDMVTKTAEKTEFPNYR